MPTSSPTINLGPVPCGAWGVGVSGGADSVALLSLLRADSRLALHVVHLDHETRGEASTGDATFVRELAVKWGLPHTLATWREVAPEVPTRLKNKSARFRAGRWALFRRAVSKHRLQGMILAHHADDQAETVLMRLARRPGLSGLGGMSQRSLVKGVVVLRPLLETRRALLRDWLRGEGQAWREDESNASDAYLRNRVRRVLEARPEWVGPLLELSAAARGLAAWTARAAPPHLAADLDVASLADAPLLLARAAAKRWLASRGVPAEELTPEVVSRLLDMAADAASPPRQHFPGQVLVRRRRGRLSAAGPGN